MLPEKNTVSCCKKILYWMSFDTVKNKNIYIYISEFFESQKTLFMKQIKFPVPKNVI